MSRSSRRRGDLRKHARAPVTLPVVVGDPGQQVEAKIEFDTRDLSIGGAFVRSELLFEVGEELALELRLPDGHKVAAKGKVVRVSRDSIDDALPGMGVAFLMLPEADREAIRALVMRGSHG